MTQIAYTKRAWRDREEIDGFLRDQRVGVLGLQTEDYPYPVPVNYVWHNQAVYFHGMGSGRKVDLLRAAPLVGFTVFAEHGTVTADMACHADTSYSSVMVFGTASAVTDPQEAAEALQALVDKLMPGYFRSPVSAAMAERHRSSMDGNPAAVFRITPDAITAKQNSASPDELFTR